MSLKTIKNFAFKTQIKAITPFTIIYQTIKGDLKTFKELEPIVNKELTIALLKLKNSKGLYTRKIKKIISNVSRQYTYLANFSIIRKLE